MDWIVTIITAAIVLVIVGIVFLIRWIINRRKKKSELPQEILDDFEEAERRYKESNGEANPYTILWQLSRDRQARNRRLESYHFPTAEREQAAVKSAVGGWPDRRESVQAETAPRAREDIRSSGKPKQNSGGNFFTRFARKRK